MDLWNAINMMMMMMMMISKTSYLQHVGIQNVAYYCLCTYGRHPADKLELATSSQIVLMSRF
jgi:hypothetical protein